MDAALYRAVNRFAAHTGWAHWFFIGMAKYGIGLFAIALLAGWWLGRQASAPDGVVAVWWAGGAALIALGIAQLIGNAVDRGRPYTAMPTAHVLTSRTSDFSFPSDHATVAGAVAVGLLLAGAKFGSRRLGWLTVGLALLLAVSRVYVGVHYPGDVFAGLALGGAVAAVGLPLVLFVFRPIEHRLSRTRLSILFSRHTVRSR
ncbi:MAG TPA: phosphatase PAP2 family protein [Acidimicrobiales bacterium]|jgi:membrane-associated phospholipid phosphatase|nr:phosphatase PAP2 family protein [Acidimicrobiales bacterium]